jgi:DNA-directed RNA polymerase subunit M/transcription elongation factor TFIIS
MEKESKHKCPTCNNAFKGPQYLIRNLFVCEKCAFKEEDDYRQMEKEALARLREVDKRKGQSSVFHLPQTA